MFPFIKRKEIVCTICSPQKREDPGLLPARKRYTGAHISLVGSMARRRPFFILSGQMGLIQADAGIPYYDHRLVPEELEPLAERVARQMRHHKVSVVFYFFEPKERWRLYTDALRMGAMRAGVGLVYMPPLPVTEPQEPMPIAATPALA